VGRVLRVLPTDTRCLITALVLIRILARRSIDGRLVIGVRSADGVTAHAWVECAGRPVLDPGDHERLLEV
jgi:hypothetical protein